jgi:hypothetical protein
MTTIVLNYCPKNIDFNILLKNINKYEYINNINNEYIKKSINNIINDDFLKNKLNNMCPDCTIKSVPNADEIIVENYDETSLINLYYDSPFIKTNFFKNNKIDFYRVLVICNDKKYNKKIILKLHYIIYPKTIHDKSRFVKYYTNLNLFWTIYFRNLIRVMVNPLTIYESFISYILNLIKTILGDIHLLSCIIVIFTIIGIIILSILYKNRKIIIQFLEKYIKLCSSCSKIK